MDLQLWSGNKITINPSELEGFILSEYGIGCDIIDIDGKTAIKVNNHFSLFTLINKIRKNFDFTVHHKKQKNEFIIIIS